MMASRVQRKKLVVEGMRQQVRGCQFAASVDVNAHFTVFQLRPSWIWGFAVTYSRSSKTTNECPITGLYTAIVARASRTQSTVFHCFAADASILLGAGFDFRLGCTWEAGDRLATTAPSAAP